MNDHFEAQEPASSCEVADELLSAYHDNELDETAAGYVHSHLDSCAICRDRLEDLESTVHAIRSLPTEASPEHDLWPEIVAQKARGGAIGQGDESGSWRWSTWQLMAAVFAGLFVPSVVAWSAITLLSGDDEPLFVWVSPNQADTQAPQPDLEHEHGHATGSLAALIAALQDDDPGVREQAARALGEFEDPRALAALAEVIRDDPVAEVRRWAAWALGEIEDPRAIRALSTAMRDTNGEVRRWAAWALGEIEDARAVRPLSAALRDDPEPEVRRWAAWALGEIEDGRAVGALSSAVRDDPEPEVRRWAAWALGEIEDARAVGALSTAVQHDPESEVRRWAAWALGEIEDARAVGGLIHAVQHDSAAEVRRWAAWALGEIEDPRAVDALASALHDESEEVRRWAAWALGEIGEGR